MARYVHTVLARRIPTVNPRPFRPILLPHISSCRSHTNCLQVLALATLQAAVFDVPHFLRVAASQHLGHQIIVVCRLVAWMGVLKRLPVVGKDLFEDAPVPRGCCHHRVAPSKGDMIVTMQRLYHASPMGSTPHQSSLGYPHPTHLSWSHRDLWDWENAFSYTIKKI